MVVIKHYENYQQLKDDANPGDYGYLDNTGVVMKRVGNMWLHQSACSNDTLVASMSDRDYSAFEVYAHDTEIPVGESIELGGYVSNAIPAEMTDKFTLRIEGNIITNDVIVDWGDNTASVVASGDYEQLVDYADEYGSKDLLMAHTYETPGKYIVKIYGKNYYTYRHYIRYFVDSDTGVNYVADTGKHNIVCRVLERDLPTASHIKNHASMWRGSQHLLHVKVDATNAFYSAQNITSCFCSCKNLISAVGFAGLSIDCSCGSTFYDNFSLTKTDLVIQQHASNISGVLRNCQKLNYDINTLMPYDNYPSITNYTDAFINCKLLSGTINPKVFWNNEYVKFTEGSSGNHYRVFQGCLLIRDQAPASWGGTASDDIIIPKSTTRIENLETRTTTIETHLGISE